MLDYAEMLRWSRFSTFATGPGRGVVLGEVRQNWRRRLIDAPKSLQILYVMKDGVVLATYARQDGDKIYSDKPGPYRIETSNFPWIAVKLITFSDYSLELRKQPDGERQVLMFKPNLDACRTLRKEWDILRQTGDIPGNIPLIDEAPTEDAAAKKDKKSVGKVIGEWVLIFFILGIVGGIWKYLLDGSPDICNARSKYFAEQVPGALDIVSRDHPMFGVIRSTLNDQGKLDQFVAGIAQAMGQNIHEGDFACFKEDVYMRLDTDDVRAQIAAVIEKQLGL